jgi:hypothetical protein
MKLRLHTTTILYNFLNHTTILHNFLKHTTILHNFQNYSLKFLVLFPKAIFYNAADKEYRYRVIKFFLKTIVCSSK